jgi:hypothetical protein
MASGNVQSFGYRNRASSQKLDWLKVLIWTAVIPGAWLVFAFIGWEAWP